MTYGQLASLLINKLIPIYSEQESRAIQRYLFTGYESRSNSDWLLVQNSEANADFENKVIASIPLLTDSVPVQYVLGKSWFCDMEFIVSPDVLIPRPETEELVMKILNQHNKEKQYRIIDIGTGSGAIAICLAKQLNSSVLTAVDISIPALTIASKNAVKHNVLIKFLHYDILKYNDRSFDCNDFVFDKYDIIVSNPPYIKESEASLMNANVLNYEPHQALFVTDFDPLIFYKAIINFSNKHLSINGTLWFEINENEGLNLSSILSANGYTDVQIFEDLNSKQRHIRAKK